jgi:hypothetical protein
MIVRNYIKGEELPEYLRTGFEVGNMPEWIWVVEREGKVVALFIAAPAHVVAILLRLLSTREAHPNDIRALLVKAMSDIKERGYKAYVTWLNPDRPAEAALLSIIQSGGGMQFPGERQVLCGGKS